MKIISLGWGTQSFTLAAMVAVGELDPIDAAIHADTTHEYQATYEFARRWTPWLEARGVRVVTVSRKNDPLNNGYGWPAIPARASSEKGGMLQRNCTRDWKIRPMRRWVANELRLRGVHKVVDVVEQWIGISLDEIERMKPSGVKYIMHRWPLIEKRMTRTNCVRWLQAHGLEIPPKSACVFCPFHNRHAWLDMKVAGGADWQKAVAVDKAIRNAKPPYALFVHADRVPLTEIKSQQDEGQLELWPEECTGLCGI